VKHISPIAATKGEPVKVKAKARCSCELTEVSGTVARLNPTCPVHGHGRPAGTGR